MKTIRLTMAQALVRWLCAQRTVIEGAEAPLFGGVFAIFGHGNVTCLGEALEAVQDQLPTWRGQNEQSMALAGDRLRQGQEAPPDHGRDQLDRPGRHEHGHRRRRRAQQSPADPPARGRHLRQPRARPGAAAGRALPRPDDHRQRRLQGRDPLLGPDRAARADHRARCRRRSRPCSIPADCGPAFLGLCQDTQAEAFDYPEVVLRAEGLAGAAAAARRRAAGRGGRAAAQGRQAADRRGRRRALCARYRRARDLRRDPPRAGGRDHRRARLPAPRSPQQRRPARRDRQRVGQRARRRGRRGARGRHAAAGLHHRLLDRVRQPGGQADRAERRALRCHQAPGARGGRRRRRRPHRAVGRARRLAGAAGVAGARRQGVRGLEPDGRSALRADQRRRCPPMRTWSARSTGRAIRPISR